MYTLGAVDMAGNSPNLLRSIYRNTLAGSGFPLMLMYTWKKSDTIFGVKLPEITASIVIKALVYRPTCLDVLDFEIEISRRNTTV